MNLILSPDPLAGAPQSPLKRIPAQYSFRPVAFYDRGGRLCGTFSQGAVVLASPDATASSMLRWAAGYGDTLRPRTIYLTGGVFADDRPARQWWREPLAYGWQITSWRTDPWRVEYTHPAEGITVELAVAAPWFGAEHDADKCYRAYIGLRFELKRRFRDMHAELLTTPASTGADLLRRSLPLRRDPATGLYKAVEYPPAPAELVAVLRAHVGQGRMECVAPAERETAPALHVYDARWQYAACVAHLPIGPWQHDDLPDIAPYRAGFYRVDAWVPPDWSQLGVVPVQDADGRRSWPREPGTVIRDAWVSSAELHIAADVAGWPVAVKERWLAARDASGIGDIGRHWMEALRELRQQTDDPLIADAARHLLIDAIGYLWRPERRVAGVAATLADLPDHPGIGDVLATEDGVEYTLPAPFGRLRAALYRPEIAATVWGRSLARTNARALMVPARDLLWVRSDAVVTAAPQSWCDQGRIGDWREKARREVYQDDSALAFPIPRDETSYRRLMGEPEGGAE